MAEDSARGARHGRTLDLEWGIECPPHEPPDDAPLVLALHGQGMTRALFAELLTPLFALPIRVLVPQAPLRTTHIRGAPRDVASWYDYDGDPARFRAELARCEDYFVRFLAQVESDLGLEPRRRVLLGFSQGGYCGAYVALRRPDLFCGMVISGARVKVEILEREIAAAAAAGFAALLCHGERDASVDPKAAQRSGEVLRAGGVAVQRRTFDSGHALGRAQATAIRDWLADRLALR